MAKSKKTANDEEKEMNSKEIIDESKETKKAEKAPNLHKDHRKKVRARYYENRFDGMPDHNILEMLLFFGIPQRDTNELAHQLIEKFGSFSAVFEAEMKDLLSIKGMTETAACLITMMLPLYKRYMNDLYSKKPSLTTTKEIAEFLKPKFVDTTNERVYALCFDLNHCLITCRLLNEGDFSSSSFDVRKLTSTVLETKAKSIVIAHNHPHGIAMPSMQDVSTTKFVFSLMQSIKVDLLDHIIVASNGETCSMLNMPRYTNIFYGLDPIFDDDESEE